MFVPPVVVTLLPILAALILLLTVTLGTTVLLRALTVIYVGHGETARLEAAEDCVLIRMLLPDLTGLESMAGDGAAIAAE